MCARIQLPSLPGYRLVEAPIDTLVHERRDASGVLLEMARGPNDSLRKLRIEERVGMRFLTLFVSPWGSTIVLDDYIRTGVGRWDYAHQAGPRATILCDYGHAYLWIMGACGAVDSVLPPGTDSKAIGAEFRAWQGEWDALSPWNKEGRQEPQGGWKPWAERGLRLCHELLFMMGPSGVLTYCHADELVRYGHSKFGLALAWEPLPGVAAARLRIEGPDPWDGRPWVT